MAAVVGCDSLDADASRQPSSLEHTVAAAPTAIQAESATPFLPDVEFVLLLTDEVESEVDDSVFRDAESLSGGKPYSVLHTVSEGDPPDKMTTIVLEYRGKGQEAEPGTTPPSPHAVGEDGDDTSTPWAEMVGYNAATGNEFSLSLPPGVIDAETLEDAVANLSTEAGPTAAGPQADGHRDTLGSAPRTQTSWSNNDDDRIRIYGERRRCGS